MTSELLISAMMPAYNAAGSIEDAIRSVLWQTEARWELIIVDDGSTDDTVDVAIRVAAGDPRIRVIRQGHAGRAVARNRCLAEARGAFVAICDADDLSLPHRFAIQVASLQGNDAVGVSASCRVLSMSADGRRRGIITSPCADGAVHAAFSRGRMPILFASSMLRTSLLRQAGGFDPELLRAQDYGLLLRVHASTRFDLVPQPLIVYRAPSALASRALVKESNFFRHYATRRASGLDMSAATFANTWRGRMYLWLLAPLMYGWFVLKRGLLRRGTAAISSEDNALIEQTLRRLAALRPAATQCTNDANAQPATAMEAE